MIPEFQNGSGVPELSPEWFRNPEPFWNVPKYVLFHIFYRTGLIIATITFTLIFQLSYSFQNKAHAGDPQIQCKNVTVPSGQYELWKNMKGFTLVKSHFNVPKSVSYNHIKVLS